MPKTASHPSAAREDKNVPLRQKSADTEQPPARPVPKGMRVLLAGITVAALAALLFLRFHPELARCGHTLTVDTGSVHEQQQIDPLVSQLMVDLNTADEEALQRISGVGPALARRIVAYREKHGPFSAYEELLAVEGIGESKLAQMKPYCTLGS